MLNLFLSILFCNIDISVIVDILAIISSSILSVVAIAISLKTLKQSSDAIFESSRANIMFYIDTLTGNQNFIVLKNFGNSSGQILDIKITPEINDTSLNYKPITNFKNITLAPNQSIKSWFNFSEYPNKIFNISLTYKTLGKTYTDNYTLDISYINSIDYLSTFSIDVHDEKSALIRLNNTIMRLTERL